MNEHDPLSDIMEQLDGLAPAHEQEQPQSKQIALKNLYAKAHTPHRSWWTRWQRSIKNNMFNKQGTLSTWAYTAVGVTLFAIIFSFPAARAAASDLLGIFRVQKFAPISISPEQLARLEDMDLEGLYPGEFVWLEEPAEPQMVDTLEEAAELVGDELWLRGWNLVDTLGDPAEIAVVDGGSGQLTVDLESARAILNIANADPTLLPDSLNGADITVSTGPMVHIAWGDSLENGITFMQTPSPEINYPNDFDPANVGEALLQVLGYEADEAYRVARSIDWTNTLIMPIPQGAATYTEVSVDGTAGILLTAVDGNGESALMWESAGQVNMLSGPDADQLLELASGWQ